MALQEVYVTREAYGPIMVLCCWAKEYQAPLYLVSNMATAEEACRLYQKRFRIETFFSDQTSRGFHIHTGSLVIPGVEIYSQNNMLWDFSISLCA